MDTATVSTNPRYNGRIADLADTLRAQIGWLGYPTVRRSVIAVMCGYQYAIADVRFWMWLFRRLIYQRGKDPLLFNVFLDPTWEPRVGYENPFIYQVFYLGLTPDTGFPNHYHARDVCSSPTLATINLKLFAMHRVACRKITNLLPEEE